MVKLLHGHRTLEGAVDELSGIPNEEDRSGAMAMLKFVCSFVRADSAVWKGADNRIELAAYAFQVMGLDMYAYEQQSLVHDSVCTLSVEASEG